MATFSINIIKFDVVMYYKFILLTEFDSSLKIRLLYLCKKGTLNVENGTLLLNTCEIM